LAVGCLIAGTGGLSRPRLWASCSMLAPTLGAQPFPSRDLPGELKNWVPWVLDEIPDHICPRQDGSALCLWPGRLQLELGSEGGSFRQEAYADRPMDLVLPGSGQHWPQSVTLDGKPFTVIEHAGTPLLRLDAGGHRIEGRFSWRQLPDSLPVPPQTAIVDLTLLGAKVPLPQREEGGLLWLRRESATRGEASESLKVRAFRKLRDGIPMFVDTMLVIEVSGKAREVELPSGALLDHSVVVATRGDLPAQLDRSGRLRLQVRNGKFKISLLARLDGPLSSLTAPKASPPWPEREVWAFEANELIRQVQVSGASPIDASRADLPAEWQRLPAFSLEPGGQLFLKETRRGEPEAPPDKIQLQREIWLDLSGDHLTFRDTFRGELRRTWRLDLLPPGELGRVMVDGENQLVTAEKEGSPAGLELRKGSLSLVADSRALWHSSLRAVGWSAGVERLGATLHLPPGWSVFGATGVDGLPGAWLSKWTLLGFFFVLLIAFGLGRLAGWRWGVVALCAVGLSYHEPDAPFLTWLSLLAATALSGVAPKGRLASLVRAWWWTSVFCLALVLVPFFKNQIQGALFPQTLSPEGSSITAGLLGVRSGGFATVPAPPPQEGAKAALEFRARDEAQVALSGHGESKIARKPSLYDQSVANYSNAALKQDPHAVLQTGPGVPTWSWASFPLTWSGPVSREHEIRLLLVSPGMNAILALVRLVLVILFAARLMSLKPPTRAPAVPAAAVAAAALLLLPMPARSQEQEDSSKMPNAEVLAELKKRLTRPEPCEPHCVTTPRLDLRVEGEQLTFAAEVHAAAKSSWTVPGPTQTWTPSLVRLDGEPAFGIARLDDGFIHVRVAPGVHRIEASGALPRQDSLTLQLKDRPRQAVATAPGWEIVGIHEDAPADESIQLSRRLKPGGSGATEGPSSSWLEVSRTLEIGVSWRVLTTVRRVSPVGSPVAVRIPLVPGESLTEGDWQTERGEVVLALSRNQEEATWASTLLTTSGLALKAPTDKPWSEVWRVRCGVVWQCRTEGLPPVQHQQDGLYEPEFRPWPGEILTVRFARPQGVRGQTLTIDALQLEATPGRRLEADELKLTTRGSREESLIVTLPTGAEIQEVKVGGVVRPIRSDGDHLPLSLPQGEQAIEIQWHQNRGISPFYTGPRVGLSVGAVNARITVKLPDDRWILMTSGPRWGPSVLFWGYLAFAALVAFILGYLPKSPLAPGQWLLLSLGLTQISALGALVVAAFFFLMAWRRERQPRSPLLYDLLQLVLLAWSVAALACLYGAVETGLVLRPEMQVAGGGSSETFLHWYLDRIEALTPPVRVVSLPLWCYRVVMLLWSLWLAASLVRWLGWAWKCFSQGGVFRPLRTSKAGKALLSDP